MTTDKPKDTGPPALSVLIRIASGVIAKPFAFVWLWRWYVVPFGLPPVTWVHGWALILLIGGVLKAGPNSRRDADKGKDGDTLLSEACGEVVIIGLAVAFGWLTLKLSA